MFDGGAGDDTLFLSGAESDYTLSTNGAGNTVVRDNRAGAPDGVIQLVGVESLVYNTPAPENDENIPEPAGGSPSSARDFEWPDQIDVSSLKPGHDHISPLTEAEMDVTGAGFRSLSDREDPGVRHADDPVGLEDKVFVQDIDPDALNVSGLVSLADDPADDAGSRPVVSASEAASEPAIDIPEVETLETGLWVLAQQPAEEGWL